MLGRLYLRRHTRRHPRWSSRGCQRRLPKWRGRYGRYQPTWAGSPPSSEFRRSRDRGTAQKNEGQLFYQRSLLSIVGLSCTTAGAAAHSPLPSVVLAIRHPRTVPRRVVRRARFAARARRLEVMKPYRHRGRLVIGEARHELLEHCPAYQCQCQRQGIESAAAVLFNPRSLSQAGRPNQLVLVGERSNAAMQAVRVRFETEKNSAVPAAAAAAAAAGTHGIVLDRS
jgi:hypothetical protein